MGNTLRKLVRMLITAFVLCAVVGVYGFSCGKTTTDLQWKTTLPKRPRSPTEMRGILQDMLLSRRVLPAPTFIPMSMWDDDVCAAAIAKAVNFIVGEERLKVAPAWLFFRANAGALKLVFSRQEDFAVQGERVVEKHDRPIWLSSKLRMVGEVPNRTAASLYIVGYLYRHTRSHELIVKAGGDLNSHLMLILGRDDGRWWGYHLLHDPEHEERNPFRIDDLGEEMPADFDLLYIWEVKDTQMPEQGGRMVFTSRAPPYETVLPFLGWGWNGALEYVLDTTFSWLRFNRSSQFPQVTKLPPMPVTPMAKTLAEADQVATEVKTEQTAVFCEKNPGRCSPVPIKRVKVERGKWPEWYVRRTPRGNMHATWDCNHWRRGTNPVIKPGQEVGICGW